MADTLLRVVSDDPSVEVRVTGLEQGSAPGRFLIEVELSDLADTANHQLSVHVAPERKNTSTDSHQRGHDCARSIRLHTH